MHECTQLALAAVTQRRVIVVLQVFDATVLGDAAVITGNLAKILVGVVGMSFNVIMLFQASLICYSIT